VLQFERHPAVLTSEVPDVGVDLEMDVIGGDLVEGLATLLAAPTVAADAVRPQVNVDTVTGLEFLPALLATVRTVIGMFEENVEFHVTLPVELPRTVRTVVADWKTFPPTPGPGVAGEMLQ